MWNPGKSSAPDEFLDLLNDEELDSDDDVVEEIEENRYEDLVNEMASLEVSHKYYIIYLCIIFIFVSYL